MLTYCEPEPEATFNFGVCVLLASLPVKPEVVELFATEKLAASPLQVGEVKFESVDQIVTDQLTNIESEFYDPKLLLKIYQNL